MERKRFLAVVMTVMMVIGNTEDYKEVVCNTGECVSETEVVKLIP